MFARKDDPRRPVRRAASDRALAAPSALIAKAIDRGEIAGDDPDRVAMAVLATLHGLAAITAGGMTGERPVDSVVCGTIRTLINGLRPR